MARHTVRREVGRAGVRAGRAGRKEQGGRATRLTQDIVHDRIAAQGAAGQVEMRMRALAGTTACRMPRHGARRIGIQVGPSGSADCTGGRDSHVLVRESGAALGDPRRAGAADGRGFGCGGALGRLEAGMQAGQRRVRERFAKCRLEGRHGARIRRPVPGQGNTRAASAGADPAGSSSLSGKAAFPFGKARTSKGSGWGDYT